MATIVLSFSSQVGWLNPRVYANFDDVIIHMNKTTQIDETIHLQQTSLKNVPGLVTCLWDERKPTFNGTETVAPKGK